MYDSGVVELTTHRIIWDDDGQEVHVIGGVSKLMVTPHRETRLQ